MDALWFVIGLFAGRLIEEIVNFVFFKHLKRKENRTLRKSHVEMTLGQFLAMNRAAEPDVVIVDQLNYPISECEPTAIVECYWVEGAVMYIEVMA